MSHDAKLLASSEGDYFVIYLQFQGDDECFNIASVPQSS